MNDLLRSSLEWKRNEELRAACAAAWEEKLKADDRLYSYFEVDGGSLQDAAGQELWQAKKDAWERYLALSIAYDRAREALEASPVWQAYEAA